MEPHLQSELDELTRRLLAAPAVVQYEFAARVPLLLTRDEPLLVGEAAQRKETLDCLRAAMAHHGVERALTKDEYAEAHRALKLPWSWQRIFRLWKSFEVAARTAAGGPLPPTWQQRDFQRRFLTGKTARSHEEYWEAIRLWLEEKPFTERAAAYDEFACQHNLTLAEGGKPLPRSSTATKALGLRFGEIVAVARGDKDYADVFVERQENTDWSSGPEDLLGLQTLMIMSGRTRQGARRLAQNADFPRPVVIVGDKRIWLREEIAAYLAGERRPLLTADRLRERYLTSAEAAELLALRPTTLIRSEDYPQRVARIGIIYLWLRQDVEEYASLHRAEIARRRRRGPSKDRPRSEFMTIATLASELEIGEEQTKGLVTQPGFPPPVRQFGGGGVWLRTAIEAYLKQEPLPEQSALADLLLDAGEINGLMALKPGRPYQYRDLPAPVARIKSGNVYLRSQLDAKLADPAVQKRLERRRLRRAQEASSSSSQATISSGEG